LRFRVYFDVLLTCFSNRYGSSPSARLSGACG